MEILSQNIKSIFEAHIQENFDTLTSSAYTGFQNSCRKLLNIENADNDILELFMAFCKKAKPTSNLQYLEENLSKLYQIAILPTKAMRKNLSNNFFLLDGKKEGFLLKPQLKMLLNMQCEEMGVNKCEEWQIDYLIGVIDKNQNAEIDIEELELSYNVIHCELSKNEKVKTNECLIYCQDSQNDSSNVAVSNLRDNQPENAKKLFWQNKKKSFCDDIGGNKNCPEEKLNDQTNKCYKMVDFSNSNKMNKNNQMPIRDLINTNREDAGDPYGQTDFQDLQDEKKRKSSFQVNDQKIPNDTNKSKVHSVNILPQSQRSGQIRINNIRSTSRKNIIRYSQHDIRSETIHTENMIPMHQLQPNFGNKRTDSSYSHNRLQMQQKNQHIRPIPIQIDLNNHIEDVTHYRNHDNNYNCVMEQNVAQSNSPCNYTRNNMMLYKKNIKTNDFFNSRKLISDALNNKSNMNSTKETRKHWKTSANLGPIENNFKICESLTKCDRQELNHIENSKKQKVEIKPIQLKKVSSNTSLSPMKPNINRIENEIDDKESNDRTPENKSKSGVDIYKIEVASLGLVYKYWLNKAESDGTFFEAIELKKLYKLLKNIYKLKSTYTALGKIMDEFVAAAKSFMSVRLLKFEEDCDTIDITQSYQNMAISYQNILKKLETKQSCLNETIDYDKGVAYMNGIRDKIKLFIKTEREEPKIPPLEEAVINTKNYQVRPDYFVKQSHSKRNFQDINKSANKTMYSSTNLQDQETSNRYKINQSLQKFAQRRRGSSVNNIKAINKTTMPYFPNVKGKNEILANLVGNIEAVKFV